MAGFTESSTIQAALVKLLQEPEMGWTHISGKHLDRDETQVLLDADVSEALIRLNPKIAEKPERVNEVLPKVKAIILSVAEEGLIPSNEAVMRWLRGLESYKFIGEDQSEPIRLFDFDDPRSNRLVLSDEVRFVAGSKDPRRYDIVLWINGFPLVIGETKTPFDSAPSDPSSVGQANSWLTAARDITDTYEVETPGFFVPNAFSFATEGKEFKFGPIGMPAEMWQPWGSTDEELLPLGLKRALRSAELLLTPEMVLEMLRSYTLYSTLRVGSTAKAIKIAARYPQVEAVKALVARAKDPTRKQGLIWHHQGSGKTLLAAFGAGKLRLELPGSTVLVVMDRLDLIEQVTREFESTGVKRVKVAETGARLRELLAENQRGVVITSVNRFKDAGVLNEREDIVVLADEAHRSQEGIFGMDMRDALPNATYIGMTGTAISEKDRDTFDNFGDPGDPDGVLSTYSPDRSMADGATLPLRVEAPRPELFLDKDSLDEAFDEMAEEEGLTEEEKELLASKASKTKTLFKANARIEAVCQDIIEHFYSKVDPLGMKAQIVCYDRELCVLYQEKIGELLKGRGEGDEATVVMTINGKKDPQGWRQYDRSSAEEAKVKARFRDAEDRLKFLIVTAKLLTGFDAPIECVMYLDKPLRKHTLFQALTRTNRRWTNPKTGQEKTHGLIVDYIGLGKEIADSMQVKRREGEKDPLSTETLIDELKAAIKECLKRFKGIDIEDTGFGALSDAQDRLPETTDREEFAREYLKVQALFELLWPDEKLREIRAQYKWLAKVYESIQPATTPDALLWHRLGAKTLDLINEHIVRVDIRGTGTERVTIDEETLEALRKLGIDGGDDQGKGTTQSPEEIIDSIEQRINERLAGSGNPAYRSLAERLEKLRKRQVTGAADSIEFLKALLTVAKDLVAVERETGEEADPDDDEPLGLLPEERRGALTQIFEEYAPGKTPDIVERVVNEIDQVVVGARFSDWQSSREGTRAVVISIRAALQKFGLDATGELFDKAYDYVAEHY